MDSSHLMPNTTREPVGHVRSFSEVSTTEAAPLPRPVIAVVSSRSPAAPPRVHAPARAVVASVREP